MTLNAENRKLCWSIPTAADFDQFVQDEYKDVYREFSEQMMRTTKTSLLIEKAEPEELQAKLLDRLSQPPQISQTESYVSYLDDCKEDVLRELDKAIQKTSMSDSDRYVTERLRASRQSFIALHEKHIQLIRQNQQIEAHRVRREISIGLIELQKQLKPRRVAPKFDLNTLYHYDLTERDASAGVRIQFNYPGMEEIADEQDDGNPPSTDTERQVVDFLNTLLRGLGR